MVGWLRSNGCHQFRHVRIPQRQAGEDGAPRRVGERGKSDAETV